MASHGIVVSAHATGNQNSSDHRAGVHMLDKGPAWRNWLKTLLYCLKFGNFRAIFWNPTSTRMASHGHARSTRTTGKQNCSDNGAGVHTLGKGPTWRNWSTNGWVFEIRSPIFCQICNWEPTDGRARLRMGMQLQHDSENRNSFDTRAVVQMLGKGLGCGNWVKQH
jgi:hypothetical protein